MALAGFVRIVDPRAPRSARSPPEDSRGGRNVARPVIYKPQH